MRICRALIQLTVGLLMLSGAARAAEPVSADLLSQPFQEIFQPEVQVSGNVIVGVMSGGAQAALLSDRLQVGVGEGLGGTEVCVRATSNDGIYSSRNHYRLPATADQAHLPYASGMGDVLDGFAAGQIAVSISPGSCESLSGETFLVAGSLDDGAAQPVTVYLNGFGATDVFFALADNGQLGSCEYIEEGRRTTYDFLCHLGEISGASSVTIVRERFGREQPEITFELIGLRQ